MRITGRNVWRGTRLEETKEKIEAFQSCFLQAL
jgi:hypothetical protein